MKYNQGDRVLYTDRWGIYECVVIKATAKQVKVEEIKESNVYARSFTAKYNQIALLTEENQNRLVIYNAAKKRIDNLREANSRLRKKIFNQEVDDER